MCKLAIASGLFALLAACTSAAPPPEPNVVLPSPPPSSGSVLAVFDGSFDAATGRLSLTFHRLDTGAVFTESLVYGTGAGDVYLHTEGTNKDGKSDAPVYDTTTHIMTATVDGENGAGSPITGFVADITSFSPAATTGMVTGGTTACSGAPLGSGASAGPCTVAYGTVAPDPSFPTPVFTSAQPWVFYAPGGSSFTFQGTVTGTLQTGGGDAGAQDSGSDSGDAGGQTGGAPVAGGVSATSTRYRMVMTTGQSPGGNGSMSSPHYQINGGVVGATQGN
jgi:hypothetical protein